MLGVSTLKLPAEHDFVTNWIDIAEISYHILYYELRIAPGKHLVLLKKAPLNLRACREYRLLRWIGYFCVELNLWV